MQKQIIEKKNKTTRLMCLYQWCCDQEAYFSKLIIALVIMYALWPLLSAPPDCYPVTADGMGHLTKIKYITDCLLGLKWPAWFPFWYNGSTVTQYYPPLSYFILVPIQIVFDNVLVTFKFFAFLTLFVGALGVWKICRRYIGPLVGIWGGVLYALQPFLMRLIFAHGAIAQGPIIALTPWFLYCSLLFMEKNTTSRWLSINILTALLILSHAMHAFLVVLGVGLVIVMMLLQGKTPLINILKWLFAVALGAGLVSFWWLPGVTQLENPGVPYLLPEAAENWTAHLNWFDPQSTHFALKFYFSLSLLIFSSLAIFFIKQPGSAKQQQTNENLINVERNNNMLVPFYFGFIISVILSFGYKIPFYKYIPFSSNLVPGRILTFSLLLGAILCSIIIYKIFQYWHSGFWLAAALAVFFISSAILWTDINPRSTANITINNESILQDAMSLLPKNNETFENGRIYWKYEVGSASTYFSMVNHLSMIQGWNPEGSPHFHSFIQHNIAIPLDKDDYVTRDLLNWNTRYAFVDNTYKTLQQSMEKNGFKAIYTDELITVLYNATPSSYFIKQQRDALVVGKAAKSLEMDFPWMVNGYSNFLEDYPDNYFSHFKLIYLIEPEYRDFEAFERIVEKLAMADKVVIVSMGREKTFPLLDIIPYWENIDSESQIITTNKGPLEGTATLEADPGGQAPAMGNTDMLWAAVDDTGRKIPAIGYKEVKGHKVYFIGLALGQQLNSSQGKEIKKILEQVMDLAHPNKRIVPTPFPVSKEEWYHDGFRFSYDSQQTVPMQISVTYAPRWKAWIDGKPLVVENMEKLIFIELPAGKHQVTFRYGMTWVGWLGIGLTFLSLLIILAFYHYFTVIEKGFADIKKWMKKTITRLGSQ